MRKTIFRYILPVLLVLGVGAASISYVDAQTSIQMLPPAKNDAGTKCDVSSNPALLGWDGSKPIKCIPNFYANATTGNIGIGGEPSASYKLEVSTLPLKATGGLILPTAVPASPAVGQMWLDTTVPVP